MFSSIVFFFSSGGVNAFITSLKSNSMVGRIDKFLAMGNFSVEFSLGSVTGSRLPP